MSARVAPVLFALAVAAVAAAPTHAAELTPLYVIPVEDRSAATSAPTTDRDAVLLLDLTTTRPANLVASLGAAAIEADATTVRYTASRQPPRPYDANETPRWLAATFIIDHDEPDVVALRSELNRAGSTARASDLVDFVARKLRKVAGEPWEPASVTARKLRGDCTEHAVLTTALARSLGIPARVVTGIVVVRPPGEPLGAYGHAWAELREGDRWIIADAALGVVARQAHYLPLGLLEDEGTGFMLQLLQSQEGWVSRIVVH